MMKLCIWMNIPSHYQSAFFWALEAREDVDLQVRYLHGIPHGRMVEGWSTAHNCEYFEQHVSDVVGVEAKLTTVEDWSERIHIICSNFDTELVNYFCKNKVSWCHWSEMPGIRLDELLGNRTTLYRLLNPLMIFLLKRREGRQIERHALGAFGQGLLAENAFRQMGVSRRKIANLYYVPAAFPESERCKEIIDFANGRKVFLTVGALCRRKGIDVLIKAFAELDTDDWCLVLCGLDRAEGAYQQLAEKLGIEDRVLFLGAYSSARIAEVYSASDVFILASRFDGWGAVLNEAASLGLPLIGTDLCGASWHVIKDGLNGYRVKADSVGKLKHAMRVYVDSPELIEPHGAISREIFLQELTPEKNADRLVKSLQVWDARYRDRFTFKLCIWMNIPSHHQSAFFSALNARDDVDLQVRYLEKVPEGRVAEGWNGDYAAGSYEEYVGDRAEVADKLGSLHDWDERIHIICSNFSPELIDCFCKNNVRWCHWSEMPGIRLAEMLGNRTQLFRLLNPLMLMLKFPEGRCIEGYALGAFGQGLLAKNAFRKMGVSNSKIANLFYVPAALPELNPCEQVADFAKGRKVFLSVGALCRRKGIDVVLEAFAKLDSNDWCLVLCGFDKADGTYQSLAKKLAVEDRVLFLGAYPSSRIAEVYSASDVFFLASRFDGWGAVLNEAASLGLPLIGTDLCGASWHLIKDGVNGFRVKAGSSGELRNAMQRYVDNPKLIGTHGPASREVFSQEFTPEINAVRMIDTLKTWMYQ